KPGLVPPAGVEPAWVRLKGGCMAALPRRVTTVGCRAGIRTRISPVNSRTCCRCHHPTSGNEWSGREDSNLYAPAPEAGGLPITLRPEERDGVSGRSRTG